MAEKRRAGAALVVGTDCEAFAGRAARLFAPMGPIDNACLEGSAPMSERDTSMPAATAAVVGKTNPSVQERNIGETIAAKMRQDINADARRAVDEMIERK